MSTRIEQLQRSGIQRVGSPHRGFEYLDAQGKRVGRRELGRIQALKLPPAWQDVAISPSAKAKLQALGKDKAGRWQYLYHPSHVQRREREKFRRLTAFADALPRMRRAIELNLRRPNLDREKVMACVLRILSTCFIRAGSQVYADENGSYGIATLLNRHVKVSGDRVVFDFPGKSKQRQHRELKDRRVANIVRALLTKPGRELFKFQNEAGEWIDVRRRHINDFIKEIMGEQFSAKDFRTWAGTLLCACALARGGACTEGKTARKKRVVAAIKETAAQLGNTPAICKASYIYPAVLAGYEQGRVMDAYFENVEELVKWRPSTLHGSERALLKLLRKAA